VKDYCYAHLLVLVYSHLAWHCPIFFYCIIQKTKRIKKEGKGWREGGKKGKE
jgi:hypothetical protein